MSGEHPSGKHPLYPNLRAPWQPGQSGNPAGRPKGSRNKLTERFWHDLYEAWQVSGPDAIQRMIKSDPGGFVRVVASQMPREFTVTRETLADLSDEDVMESLAAIRAALGDRLKKLKRDGAATVQ